METLIRVLTPVIPLLFLGALIAVPVFYVGYRKAPEPKQALSILRYIALTAVAGIAGYVVGTMAGIFAACSSEASGNLCGLIGVFGVGPLVSALAIFLTARHLTRAAQRAL
ncbi:MAG: hypothetical protein ACREL4_03730 [Gemmatimonadales bacterium]